MDGEKFEFYHIIKGNYYIKISLPVASGRAVCIHIPALPYKELTNKYSGNRVVRNQPRDSNRSLLGVCSDGISNAELYQETKLGFISYYLPDNWDEFTLKEMDSIVESIMLK